MGKKLNADDVIKAINSYTNNQTKTIDAASKEADVLIKRLEALREANFKIWRAGGKSVNKEVATFINSPNSCNLIDYTIKQVISSLAKL